MSAAEVLLDHVYRTAVNTSRAWCWCGWNELIVYSHKTGMQLHAAHQLDALKAAGYAVVELPKSTEKGDLPDEGYWLSFPEGVSATYPHGRVFDQDADLDPADARSLAAALLAAADAAEATS